MTAAVRRAIQHSQESVSKLVKRYAVNDKMVGKWRKRRHVHDAPMGPILSFRHAVCRNRIARYLSPKIEALATMIHHEQQTYN